MNILKQNSLPSTSGDHTKNKSSMSNTQKSWETILKAKDDSSFSLNKIAPTAAQRGSMYGLEPMTPDSNNASP